MPETCILLEDRVGCKQTDKRYTASWAPRSYTDERILKGSLLVELTETETRDTQLYFTNLNYKKYSDDSVKLYCEPERVHQLNDKQFNLLLGVRTTFDRYKALNILNWVETLKTKDIINVTIPTIPHPVKGIVQYIGPLPGEEGTKFGIELLVSQCVLNVIYDPVTNVCTLGEERGRSQ